MEQSSKIQPHSWSDLVQDEDLNNEYQEYDLRECPWMQDAVMEKNKVLFITPAQKVLAQGNRGDAALLGNYWGFSPCWSMWRSAGAEGLFVKKDWRFRI